MPKADLRQAMRESAKTAPNPILQVRKQAQPVEKLTENPHYRPGRANKVNLTGYFPPEVKKQLRMMCAEQDKTIQQILAEALNDLFAKHGKPEIAPMSES